MKRNYVLSILFAGLMVFSMSGFAIADMEQRSEAPVELLHSNQTVNDTDFYAPGAWSYEGPVEAGSIPMNESLSKAQLSSNPDEGFTLIESGGIPFRVEVDTD